VDGASVNPFHLLIRPECRVDEEKAQAMFMHADVDQAK
jgi:hypothetical protein